MQWLFALVLAVGCAASSAQDPDVSDRLRALRADHTKLERRLEETENRLMLLEDRLDTRRVADEADGRTPTLPVVKLSPPPPDPVEPAEPGDDAPAEDGAAAEDDSPRPLLRLHGRGAKKRSAGPAEPIVVEERLPVVPLPGKKAQPAAAPGNPLAEYRKSHDLVVAGKYDEAQQGFEAFLRAHPSHDYADNAAYWVAECHYARRDWTAALVAFRTVVDTYPRGNKAPDALLKLGYTYLAAGDREAAVQVLQQVARTFPRAQVAALAQARLEEIHD